MVLKPVSAVLLSKIKKKQTASTAGGINHLYVIKTLLSLGVILPPCGVFCYDRKVHFRRRNRQKNLIIFA